MVNRQSHLIVKARDGAATGQLTCGNLTMPCALGPAGLTDTKTEGDGKTPTGALRLVRLYYRADRLSPPPTGLPSFAISESDGWCDAPLDAAYNSAVTLPFAASHEKLWRDDHAYDLCIVLDYNLDPASPHKGSAIFFHLAKSDQEGLQPTEGCIAISQENMRQVLALVDQHSVLIVQRA